MYSLIRFMEYLSSQQNYQKLQIIEKMHYTSAIERGSQSTSIHR